MKYVRKLVEIGAADAGSFGERSVYLGKLMRLHGLQVSRAGLPIAPGFCLSAEAYREFIGGDYIDKTIARILAGLKLNDPEDIEVRTEQVRNFLITRHIPERLAQEVLQSYYELGAELDSRTAPVPVSVRPSESAFDLSAFYYPAPGDTHLNVVGEGNLLDHIKRCWGSLWTAKAVAFRLKQGIDHSQVGVAVVVQAMIQPEVDDTIDLCRT
jgi:pyruvate, water dikinase